MRAFRHFQVEAAPGKSIVTSAICHHAERLAAFPCGGPLQLFDLGRGIRLWSRRCDSLAGMTPHPGLLTLSFSADGEAIVAVSSNDAVVHLIDARIGAVIRRIQLPDVAGNDCHAVRLDASGRFVVLNGCAGTACFSLLDGTGVWGDFAKGEEACAESLHVTRYGDAIYPMPDGSILVRSVETGALRIRCRGTGHFVVSDDESELVTYGHSQGFTRVSLVSGEVVDRLTFEPRVSRFDWSSRHSLIAALDDSGSPERIVVIDLRAGQVVDATPLPAGVECWRMALNPYREGSVIVVTDDCIIRDFRLR